MEPEIRAQGHHSLINALWKREEEEPTEKTFNAILQVIPKFERTDFNTFKLRIYTLLEKWEDPSSQAELAQVIGDWACTCPDPSISDKEAEPIYYYTKGIQIAEKYGLSDEIKRKLHQSSSKQLLAFAKSCLFQKEMFIKRLDQKFERQATNKDDWNYHIIAKQLDELKNLVRLIGPQDTVGLLEHQDHRTPSPIESLYDTIIQKIRVYLEENYPDSYREKMELSQKIELPKRKNSGKYEDDPHAFRFSIDTSLEDLSAPRTINFHPNVPEDVQNTFKELLEHALNYIDSHNVCALDISPISGSLGETLSDFHVSVKCVSQFEDTFKTFEVYTREAIRFKILYDCENQAIADQKQLEKSAEYPTEKYRRAFVDYKRSFEGFIGNIEDLQNRTFAAFQKLVNTFLDDAFAILGPPPCHYDLRAMGSCGRKEISSLSDLEPMILVENDQKDTLDYFTDLVKILRLQIISTGDTSSKGEDNTKGKDFCFTVLSKTCLSGFHLEPINEVIKSPAKMLEKHTKAPQLSEKQEDPASAKNMTLHSTSLAQSTSRLFEDYEKKLREADKNDGVSWNVRFSLGIVASRLEDYTKLWGRGVFHEKKSLHLKDDFIKTLNYLISDLATFYGIFDEANLFKIMDRLDKQFHLDSREKIKKALENIYRIRVRLHNLHAKDHFSPDVAFFPNDQLLNSRHLSPTEFAQLEIAYWTVLRPLYSAVERIIDGDPDLWYKPFDKFANRLNDLKPQQSEAGLIQQLFDEIKALLQKRLRQNNQDPAWQSIIKPFYENLTELIESNQSHMSKIKAVASELRKPKQQLKRELKIARRDVLPDDWHEALSAFANRLDTLVSQQGGFTSIQQLLREIKMLLRKRLREEAQDESWRIVVKPFYENLIQLIDSKRPYTDKAKDVVAELRRPQQRLKRDLKVARRQKKMTQKITRFREAFHNLNLVDIAYQEHLRHYQKWILEADHAIATKDKDGLRSIYNKQEQYLSLLKKRGLAEVAYRLEQLPDKSGFRQGFRSVQKLLRAKLDFLFPADDVRGDPYVKVRFSSLEERYLARGLTDAILENGHFNLEATLKSINSQHSVICLDGYGVHIKERPFQPLMEYAIHTLLFRLFGDLTPPSQLVRFEVEGVSYPVLVSQTIDGNVLRPGQYSEDQIDKASWTQHILAAILTRPADGRGSNYILTKEGRIYCVDNDVSFVRPLKKGLLFDDTLFCSVLFSLFEGNMPLDERVLEDFCALNIDAILNEWLDDLIEKEQEYRSDRFFSEEEYLRLQAHVEESNSEKKKHFFRNMILEKGQIRTLYIQALRLQLSITENLYHAKAHGGSHSIGSFHLLSKLIELSDDGTTIINVSEKIYRKFKDEMTAKQLEARQQANRKHHGEFSQSSSTNIALYRTEPLSSGAAEKIESLVQAKEELNFNVKIKGMIAHAESTVIEHNFYGYTSDLYQLAQHFILQQHIANFKDPKVKPPASITITNCLALPGQHLERLLSANLSDLDLSYTPKLQNENILMIARCPNLKYFSARGCLSLTEIVKERPFLGEPVPVQFESLEMLDLSNCAKLKSAYLDSGNLKFIKVSHNPKIDKLVIKTKICQFGFVDAEDTPNFRFSANQSGDLDEENIGSIRGPASSKVKEIGNIRLWGMFAAFSGGIQFDPSKNISLADRSSIPKDCAQDIVALTQLEDEIPFEEIENIIASCPNLKEFSVRSIPPEDSDQIARLIQKHPVIHEIRVNEESQNLAQPLFESSLLNPIGKEMVAPGLNWCYASSSSGVRRRAELDTMHALKIPSHDTKEFVDENFAHFISLSALTSLDLSGCGQITSNGIGQISYLTQIERIVLSGCEQVTDHVFQHIRCFTNLTDLDLSRSWITGYGVELLTPLSKLVSLNISSCLEVNDNSLGGLTALISLENLDMCRCNRITDRIFDVLASLTALRSLNLSFSQVTAEGLFSNPLASLEALEIVSLESSSSGSETTEQSQFTDPVIDEILNMNLGYPNLKQSFVIKETISDSGVEQLIQVHPNLSKVLVNKGTVSDESLRKYGLRWCYTISNMDCEGRINTDFVGVKRIEITSLNSLDLSNSHWFNDQGLHRIPLNLGLTQLKLDDCQWIAGQALEPLSQFSTLHSLSLSRCYNLEAEGLTSLKLLPALTQLDLSGNWIEDQDIRYLSSFVSLKDLNLSWCPLINGDGVQHLSRVTTLKSLRLRYCEKLVFFEHFSPLTFLTLLDLRRPQALPRESKQLTKVLPNCSVKM